MIRLSKKKRCTAWKESSFIKSKISFFRGATPLFFCFQCRGWISFIGKVCMKFLNVPKRNWKKGRDWKKGGVYLSFRFLAQPLPLQPFCELGEGGLQTDIALIVLFSTRYAGSVGNNNIFLLQHACCIFGVLIVLFSGPRATFCFSVKVPFGGLKIPKYFGVGALAFCDNTCFFGANLFSGISPINLWKNPLKNWKEAWAP